MFLENNPIISQHKQGSYINNLDIVRIASLVEYNTSYAMALLISHDTELVKTIIATYNEIEDRCNVLLDIYEQDILSSKDTLYSLHNTILQIFKVLNEDIIDVIKLSSQILEEINSENTALLQAINEYISLLFKASIDAYIQQDAEIISNSIPHKERLFESNATLKKYAEASISHQIKKISASIIAIQDAITSQFS